MRFEFDDPFLEALACDPDARSPWPETTLRLYQRRVQQIESARVLGDLLAAAALDVRALSSDGSLRLSLRIDDTHRLVVQVMAEAPKPSVMVLQVRSETGASTRDA